MASVTDICNRALQKIGAGRITNITDQSVNARACATCYEILRDALQRAHPWNFTIQRFSLAASATAPAFGPANAFPLPTGCLGVLPPDPSMNSMSRDWTIESQSLLTNDTAPLNVRCKIRTTDTTLFDPLFVEALASKMAIELCEALTQSNTKKATAVSMYKEAILDAKKANAIEKVPQVAPTDEWITARQWGSGTPGDSGWGY